MTKVSAGIELCCKCGEEIRGEVCSRCSMSRRSSDLGEKSHCLLDLIKKSKLVMLIAGVEVISGVILAVLAILALIREPSAISAVFMFLSSLFVTSGILLWRRHQVGWILSLINQIISIPQIDLENFSWAIEMPSHMFLKYRRGNHYYGIDAQALFFAIALFFSWRNYRRATAERIKIHMNSEAERTKVLQQTD